MGRLIFIILFIFISAVGQAKIAPRNNPQQDVLKYEKELHRLNAKISTVEKDLQKTNKKYISAVKRRNFLEEKNHKMQLILEEESSKLNEKNMKLKNLLKGVILSKIDDNQTPAQMLSLDILMKDLKRKIEMINDQKVMNVRRQNDLKSMQEKISSKHRNEHSLIMTLGHLERKKQVFAHKYVEAIEKKEGASERLTKVRNQSLLGKKIQFKKGIFISPIKKFEKIETVDGDMRYVFKGNMPIYAPRKGRVIKVSIARYWNGSIIIDHGKDIRSIIYGEFSAIVKEGDLVEQGKLIGYGTTLKKTKAEINFGVRMGNKTVDASRFIKYN